MKTQKTFCYFLSVFASATMLMLFAGCHERFGCYDAQAVNFDPEARMPCESCCLACKDPGAINYHEDAHLHCNDCCDCKDILYYANVHQTQLPISLYTPPFTFFGIQISSPQKLGVLYNSYESPPPVTAPGCLIIVRDAKSSCELFPYDYIVTSDPAINVTVLDTVVDNFIYVEVTVR